MTKNSQGSGEFSLIRDYFYREERYHPETVLGVGDDAALLNIPEGQQLVVSVDTMVEGVHFLQGSDPEALGHKLLAVNLSDMAAMGANPMWATLALTIPCNDPAWLEPFSRGIFALADRFRVDLVGGDTTRGPLTLTLQIHGTAPAGEAIHRSGAADGDLICVTNALGAAGLALKRLKAGEGAEKIRHTLERPTPQLEAGILLRSSATAMIDISDGLLADLSHILERSGVGADLNLDAIPLHPALEQLPLQQQLDLAMTAGDDYELCFTLPTERLEGVTEQLSEVGTRVTVVGRIRQELGIGFSGTASWHPSIEGYQHF